MKVAIEWPSGRATEVVDVDDTGLTPERFEARCQEIAADIAANTVNWGWVEINDPQPNRKNT